MVDWKRKKLWVEQKTSQAYTQINIFYWQLEAPHRKQLKQKKKKKLRTVGYITPLMDHLCKNG